MLAAVVIVHDVPALAVLYGLLAACFLAARVPGRIFPLTLYPLLFAVLFIFVSGFQVRFILMVFFKVLCGSTAVVVLLSTTPYPAIFRVLERLLPALLVTALFLTYRSIFSSSTCSRRRSTPSTCGGGSAGAIRGGGSPTWPTPSAISSSKASTGARRCTRE